MASLLSKYYYRKYMIKTLTERYNNPEGLDEIKAEIGEIRSLLSTMNESYESAVSGFFVSSGSLVSENR